jgi:hypothetical protein
MRLHSIALDEGQGWFPLFGKGGLGGILPPSFLEIVPSSQLQIFEKVRAQ